MEKAKIQVESLINWLYFEKKNTELPQVSEKSSEN